MKKHLNILLILLFVCLFAFAMVACNKDGGNTTPNVPDQPRGDDPEPAVFTVTFDSKGGTSLANFNTTVEYGSTIAQPVNRATGLPVVPTRTGYVFNGWTIGTTAEEFIFGYTKITANTVITANWLHKDYALPVVLSEYEEDLEYVSLKNDKGESISALPVTYDTRSYLASPTTTKDGDKFEYWYYKNDKDEQVRFTAYADGANQVYQLEKYLFDKSITIYAMWHSHLPDVTVTYDANGGNITSSTGVTVKIRDGVEKPLSDPTKDGYAFKYWYYLNDLGEEMEFDFLDTEITDDTYTQVMSSMTVYAKWMRAITISSANDLDAIRTTVANNDEESVEYATAKYTLDGDIIVSDFAPLFTSSTHFAGEFDGAGHTITINNFAISDVMSFLGYNDGKVKNLNLIVALNATYPTECTVTKFNIGAVASFNTGDVIGVSSTVTGNVNLKDITFGGIVANNAGGELSDVTTHTSFTSFEGLKVVFGGIVGNNTSGLIINSTAETTVKYNAEQALKATSLYVGGIVGQITGGAVSKANVKAFDVNFGASQTAYAGGVAGTTQGIKLDQALVKSAIVKGSANTTYAGGVAGLNGGSSSNCEVESVNVDVTAISTAYAGGFVGANTNGTGTAKLVYSVLVNGNVVVTSENGKVYAGAIAGMAESSAVSYSYSNATVSAYALANNEGIGNVIGKYSSTANITNVYFGESTVLKLNDETYELVDGVANFPVCKTAAETLATTEEITTESWVKSKLGLNPDSEEIWTITDGTTPKLTAFVA